MPNISNKYTVDVDLTRNDDDLCDGLPWDVLVRFAHIKWLLQYERRVKKLEELNALIARTGLIKPFH